MRLGDVARPADHHRKPRPLENARFCGIGHAVRAVVAGQGAAQQIGRVVVGRHQWRHLRAQTRLDAGLGVDRAHARQQLGLAELGHALDRLVRIVAGQGAIAPLHEAVAGDDVVGGAALDDADVDRAEGRAELAVLRRPRPQLVLEAIDEMDQLAAVMDGVDALVRRARMGFQTDEVGEVARRRLVRMHHLHHGRFADDHRMRLRQVALHGLGQRPGAETADLLVVAQRQMDRHRHAAGLEMRHHGERDGGEGLHVGSATAVEQALLLDHGERIAVPGLVLDRHHVGMARQHHAALALGADRGVEVGLGAVLVGDQPALDAVAVEVVAHEIDQRHVGIGRRRVEGDETTEHFDRIDCLRHGAFPSLFGRPVDQARQNPGRSSITKVRISRRPSSMPTASSHLAPSGSEA